MKQNLILFWWSLQRRGQGWVPPEAAAAAAAHAERNCSWACPACTLMNAPEACQLPTCCACNLITILTCTQIMFYHKQYFYKVELYLIGHWGSVYELAATVYISVCRLVAVRLVPIHGLTTALQLRPQVAVMSPEIRRRLSRRRFRNLIDCGSLVATRMQLASGSTPGVVLHLVVPQPGVETQAYHSREGKLWPHSLGSLEGRGLVKGSWPMR